MIRRTAAQALCAAVAMLSLAACAHGGPPAEAGMGEPSEQPLAGRAALYAACVRAASDAGAVKRLGSYLRFTCEGAPAHGLYDEAETYARARGLETATPGRITRRFNTTAWDDQCWTDGAATPAFTCQLTMPMRRDFVNGVDTPPTEKK